MELKQYLEQTANKVDSLIHQHFGSACDDLGRASAHLLLAGGKRLRPALLLLAADAVNRGSSSNVVPAALALELTHSFTLIHDDIMDGDTVRRGVPTVHTQWDEPTAILAGDVLFATAFEFICLADVPDNAKVRATSLLARTCVEICEGQHMDMSFEEQDDVSEGEYFKLVEKKTGALYAAAAGIGSILAQGNPRYTDALFRFGQGIGMAFQIQDDLIDLLAPPEVSGKDQGSDLRKGKKTLIYLKAREKGLDLAQFRGHLSPDQIREIVSRLREIGVIDEVQETAENFVRKSIQRISILPDSEEKSLLIQMGEHFIRRSY